MKDKSKRRHVGRIAVLLDREATPILRRLAKKQDRSLNKTASHAVIESGMRAMALKVILHSNSESAANATDSTLRMLPSGGAFLERGEDGKVAFDTEGRATVVAANPEFVSYALKNQGYVRAVQENTQRLSHAN